MTKMLSFIYEEVYSDIDLVMYLMTRYSNAMKNSKIELIDLRSIEPKIELINNDRVDPSIIDRAHPWI